MEEFTLATAIVAIIEWIKNVDKKHLVTGWVTLPIALLVGGIAGFFNFFGTSSVETGIIAGFLAVGGVTIVSKTKGV